MAHKRAPIAEHITSGNSKKRFNKKLKYILKNKEKKNLKCRRKQNQIFSNYSHFFMDFCSSYAGFLNASSKNQMLFTAQIKGRNANPTK